MIFQMYPHYHYVENSLLLRSSGEDVELVIIAIGNYDKNLIFSALVSHRATSMLKLILIYTMAKNIFDLQYCFLYDSFEILINSKFQIWVN